ncbi:MAG: alpha/beta hydrolase [Pseudomonadota bacterium]
MPLAQVNNTEIWYSVQGEGVPVLLLPGLGLDHHYYRLGEPLLRKKTKTILVDPRGIGESRKDSPKTVRYTPELWADDFAALLDYLNIPKAHIVGSSLGAAMAMALVEKYPEKAISLTTIGGFSELDEALVLNFQLRKKIIAKLGMGEELADFMGLFTMTREFLETPDGRKIMEANQSSVKKNSPELYTAFLDSILWWGRKMPGQESEPLFTTRLKNINCPTLAAAGDNDYYIPSSFTKRIADNVRGAVYAEIHHGGHIPFIEKPVETAELVLDFLQGQAGT